MAEEFTGFTTEAFSFWKGLERHNNRDWFQAHKDQYEQAVRRPMQLLIEELAPLYGPGRLSRINKDMRFQKEKPYKNYLATGLGGSYISFSKEGLWVGTGIYKPEPATLRALRAAIADDSAGRELTRIIAAMTRKGFEVDTHARLDKPPRGYDAAHPRVELLRMKDIYVGKSFGVREVASANLPRDVAKAITALEPFRVWLRKYVRERP
ncbi:MAG TPA: DUF2461 domain-containing protein, partial [Vicinamibacterales bacterium]|nr:DUF2461 domain-containing protein [Vicinamibacterales bacterium]